MIIERPAQIKSINQGKWIIIFGRRKTGKTFLVENFTKYDEFFFVKRDRTIIEKKRWNDYNYDTFKEIIIRDLEAGKTIVIDEFHRLGDDFLDFLHALPQKGKLKLISSTLHYTKLLINRHSPVLGKFGEVTIGLIDILDILKVIKGRYKNLKQLMEVAIFLQEPITINFINDENLLNVIIKFRFTVPALLGEIFIEEDRKLTQIYESILRATAVGKVKSGEISSYIFSRKLIKKDDPSIIQQYLVNLVNFGILYRVHLWNKKRAVYKHTSPLSRLFFYLDEKYSFAERDVSIEEMSRYIEEIMPRIIEDAIRDLFAKIYNLTPYLFEAKDYEVDGILSKFKKPEIAIEIKWKKKIDSGDVNKAVKNLNRINAERKILFVPDKKGLKSNDIEILDVSDIVKHLNND